MKKLLLPLAALLFMASCNNAPKNEASDSNTTTETSAATANEGIGVIKFQDTAFDFGSIKEGEVVKHDFIFTNTGNAPVILAQVSASCGCTTPKYTSEPVLPGKDGVITVEFNSENQVGQQQKIITVASNAESNIMTVQLKGTVNPKS